MRGEAYFEVKHEAPGRPFIVDAGLATVRALGTAFNVRRNADRVAVTVAEGRVQVARTEGGLLGLADAAGMHRAQAVEMSRAQQVVIQPKDAPIAVAAADPRRASAWRQGRLEFVDEPLDVVIANVSRYSRTTIVPRRAGAACHHLHGHLRPGSSRQLAGRARRSLSPGDSP